MRVCKWEKIIPTRGHEVILTGTWVPGSWQRRVPRYGYWPGRTMGACKIAIMKRKNTAHRCAFHADIRVQNPSRRLGSVERRRLIREDYKATMHIQTPPRMTSGFRQCLVLPLFTSLCFTMTSGDNTLMALLIKPALGRSLSFDYLVSTSPTALGSHCLQRLPYYEFRNEQVFTLR